MIFSELYSTYYNTVAKILKTAVDHPLSKNEYASCQRHKQQCNSYRNYNDLQRAHNPRECALKPK